MSIKKQLAQRAVGAAAKLRAHHQVPPGAAVDIYDLADKEGIDVRFTSIPSMEGVYQADAKPRPVILISTLRPPGRRAHTCGHELGHHVFGHGSKLEQLVGECGPGGRFDPDEYLVDVFSAAVRMPTLAVRHQATLRSIDLSTCPAEDVYTLSTVFGASYGGFLNHASATLKLIDARRAAELRRCRPKCLREKILGRPCPGHLLVADRHGAGPPIDLEVGDEVLLPAGAALEGAHAEFSGEVSGRPVIRAASPGIGRVTTPGGWAAFVRVSERGYAGLAEFRFDEDVDVED